jgi:hypothetical protein
MENSNEMEGFDDQVREICMKTGYIRFYSSSHPERKLIMKEYVEID